MKSEKERAECRVEINPVEFLTSDVGSVAFFPGKDVAAGGVFGAEGYIGVA